MNEQSDERHKVHDSFGVLSAPMSAVILDVSLQGMAIQSPLNLKVNNKVSLNLRNGKTVSHLDASVVWSFLEGAIHNGSDEAPVYRAGLMFSNTLNSMGKETIDFIHDNLTYSLQKRMFQRFKVENRDRIRVEQNISFFVKMIGISDMLIETRFPIEVDSQPLIQMSLGNERFRGKGRTAYMNRPNAMQGQEIYQLGIEFVDLDEKNIFVLENYILNKKMNSDA